MEKVEKILEIEREEGMLVVRLRLPKIIPEPARSHFRNAFKEFVSGFHSLITKEKKEGSGPVKIEIE